MHRFLACLITTILVSSAAAAEERSFVFLDLHRDRPHSLTAVCQGPDKPMSHKDMIQFAKKLGFRTGSCAAPYGELATSFFTVGIGPLYLTPTQTRHLVKTAEERGILEPYHVSDTWPPKD